MQDLGFSIQASEVEPVMVHKRVPEGTRPDLSRMAFPADFRDLTMDSAVASLCSKSPQRQERARMRMRTCGTALVIETPAKVNLSLRVTGKRPDGFHELETLMLSVGLFDRLTFEPAASGIHLTCDSQTLLQADENNLVLKAARLLAATHHVTDGVMIRLRKSIPMQAGMGGRFQ